MPRSRRTRRALGREEAKLRRERERLVRLEPGGSPERPRDVESPAQIDVIAERMDCLRCDAEMRLEQHAAEEVCGVSLRVARLICTACDARREVWFRLAGPILQ